MSKLFRASLFIILLLNFSILISCSTVNRDIEKGEASLRLGDYAMAIRFFEGVLNRNPENFEARLGMGKSLIQQAVAQGGDSLIWSRALTHLEAARSIRPNSKVEPLLSDTWLIHARQGLETHDTLGALKSLGRAIDLNPKAVEALNLAGIIYYRMGDSEKATILFRSALAADSLRPFTYFNLGMVQWAKMNYVMAHQFWFKALQLAPEDKDILYWFASAQKKVEELGK